MAIYHLEAKVISRGAGRSAVAAAAYMSCSQILNDYDGVQHDYTRKQGLVWQQIFLPEYAPAEWSDRGTLWNAVEENEKTKDSRLAREFVVALPIEMGKAEWESLLTEFIQDNFVSDGMRADVCIHDTDGHNPHAHIMVTVRPLDEKGKWHRKDLVYKKADPRTWQNEEKEELREIVEFLKNPKKAKVLAFILMTIPGTPKDFPRISQRAISTAESADINTAPPLQ